ncbi:hypothetical protein D3C81_1070630 [compost metagenome]
MQHIVNVEESIPLLPDINKSCLHTWNYINYTPFKQAAYHAAFFRTLNRELHKSAMFQQCHLCRARLAANNHLLHVLTSAYALPNCCHQIIPWKSGSVIRSSRQVGGNNLLFWYNRHNLSLMVHHIDEMIFLSS